MAPAAKISSTSGLDLTHISPMVAESIDRVLTSVRSYLGMDVAFVSEFTGADRVFRNVNSARENAPIKVGGVVPLAEGYCQHVVEGRLPELIPNTSDLPLARVIPETQQIPIGSHLSVPIRLREGKVFGTFCCFSYLPNPKLDRRDLELMRTFAQLVGRQIDAEIANELDREDTRNRLRAALAAGDPHIVYQPICRLSDGAVVGVEALSRFASEPRQGPDLWFADAARVGAGERLELMAVKKAIEGAAAIPAPIAVNVNVSPATLIAGKFAEAIGSFDRSRLVIEITEHEPITDYEPLLAALAPFREKGAAVAIDDAGAGYSSLKHVLTMRPDIIKFDISITRDIDHDPMRQALVAAMVEFARHTGTRIVAEGIETEAELATLRKLGVEKGQGYYFSKPKTARAVADSIAQPIAKSA